MFSGFNTLHYYAFVQFTILKKMPFGNKVLIATSHFQYLGDCSEVEFTSVIGHFFLALGMPREKSIVGDIISFGIEDNETELFKGHNSFTFDEKMQV